MDTQRFLKQWVVENSGSVLTIRTIRHFWIGASPEKAKRPYMGRKKPIYVDDASFVEPIDRRKKERRHGEFVSQGNSTTWSPNRT